MKKNNSEIDRSFIDYLVKKIKDENLSSLEIIHSLKDEHRYKIKISNTISSTATQVREEVKLDYESAKQKDVSTPEASQKPEEIPSIIKSPMVGTVYLSPSPEEPTFIQVGKKIKKGDTILIIEAMKTMNQIPSTLEGTVKEILVNNESPVEFETPLVIIEP